MTPAQNNAREQVGRLLKLVPFLYAHRDEGEGVSVDAAAAALGVTSRQVLGDLKVLLMCGTPGGYPDDLIDVDLDALEGDDAEGMIRVSNADYLARPMRLQATEAAALIVALRTLHAASDPDTREIVDRVLAKLEGAAATGAAESVDVGGSPASLDVDEALLHRAIDEDRQLELVYYVPSRDEESRRVVDPHRVLTQDGAAYLDAWCHSAEAKRLFRIDRIRSASLLDSAVATTPDPTPLSDSIFEIGTGQVATLLLGDAARWVPEYYPVIASREVDGGLEVDLAYADRRWMERLLLRLAPHAQVVRPAELTEAVHSRAQQMLALYAHQ